jgi:trans-aconitate 2-methyltransferase
MPWDPKVYNKFKDIRYQPFYDLIALIQPAQPMNAVDLGCGTGEQTAILAEKFPDANFLGIDASAEMLKESSNALASNLRFRQSDIETFAESSETWDLIFSNAALQWADDHEVLFPKLIGKLVSGGQFAIQMPVQTDNILNRLLLDLVNEEPFNGYLNGWSRVSPVLSMDAYAQILFDAGIGKIEVIQKVYPIIASDHETLYNFIAGSALIPYMERLNAEQTEIFTESFRKRIAAAFPKLPAIYAFKRLLLYGRKP